MVLFAFALTELEQGVACIVPAVLPILSHHPSGSIAAGMTGQIKAETEKLSTILQLCSQKSKFSFSVFPFGTAIS